MASGSINSARLCCLHRGGIRIPIALKTLPCPVPGDEAIGNQIAIAALFFLYIRKTPHQMSRDEAAAAAKQT